MMFQPRINEEFLPHTIGGNGGKKRWWQLSLGKNGSSNRYDGPVSCPGRIQTSPNEFSSSFSSYKGGKSATNNSRGSSSSPQLQTKAAANPNGGAGMRLQRPLPPSTTSACTSSRQPSFMDMDSGSSRRGSVMDTGDNANSTSIYNMNEAMIFGKRRGPRGSVDWDHEVECAFMDEIHLAQLPVGTGGKSGGFQNQFNELWNQSNGFQNQFNGSQNHSNGFQNQTTGFQVGSCYQHHQFAGISQNHQSSAETMMGYGSSQVTNAVFDSLTTDVYLAGGAAGAGQPASLGFNFDFNSYM